MKKRIVMCVLLLTILLVPTAFAYHPLAYYDHGGSGTSLPNYLVYYDHGGSGT